MFGRYHSFDLVRALFDRFDSLRFQVRRAGVINFVSNPVLWRKPRREQALVRF